MIFACLQLKFGSSQEFMHEQNFGTRKMGIFASLQVKFGSSRGLLDFQSPGGLDTSWVQVGLKRENQRCRHQFKKGMHGFKALEVWTLVQVGPYSSCHTVKHDLTCKYEPAASLLIILIGMNAA